MTTLQQSDDKFIRVEYDRDISCTITAIDSSGQAQCEYSFFKEALSPISYIVFYEYANKLYYSVALEFRGIDNNLLYNIFELQIRNTTQLIELLTSSMEKEEHWSNEFNVAVVHVKTPPRFCIELPDSFVIDSNTTHHYQ